MELKKHLTMGIGMVWRVVETQAIAATRDITSSAAEQQRLEELLEQSKPTIPNEYQGLSYLLMTPFRYPPLPYGSRFGSTYERGIFYASVERTTAFAESAVYLWLFQKGPKELGPLECIRDQRTAFSVKVRSNQSLDLCQSAFKADRAIITAPDSWEYTQKLGSEIRKLGAEYFLYPSARLAEGTNAAVLNPKAFYTNAPSEQQTWSLRLSTHSCWFGRAGEESVEFRQKDFEKEGRLLHPSM